jgi:pimeloyl-ACP methyl ester carboxylesterase
MRRIMILVAVVLGGVSFSGIAILRAVENKPSMAPSESQFSPVAASEQHSTQTMKAETVDVNGMKMYYEVSGKGEPLLLVHGFSSSGRETWTPFVAQLSAKYRLVIPDLRGHGRSTNPSDEFTHRQCALDIYALLDHLGIRDFRAMGISSGGMALLHMATQQPDRVKAMVLIGATHSRKLQNQIRLTEDDLLDENGPWGGFKRLRKVHLHGDEQIRKLCRDFVAIQKNPNDMKFTHHDLREVKAETLIIHGDRDAFFPVQVPFEMYRSIPRASLWIVPNGGHVPIFGERTLFLSTTLGFLDNSWRTLDVKLQDTVYPYGPR